MRDSYIHVNQSKINVLIQLSLGKDYKNFQSQQLNLVYNPIALTYVYIDEEKLV